jgi:OpgC protein
MSSTFSSIPTFDWANNHATVQAGEPRRLAAFYCPTVCVAAGHLVPDASAQRNLTGLGNTLRALALVRLEHRILSARNYAVFQPVLLAVALCLRLVVWLRRFKPDRLDFQVTCDFSLGPRLGSHSLPIFCLGVLLSFYAYWILTQYSDAVSGQIAVSGTGIAIMVITAWVLERIEKSQICSWKYRCLKVLRGAARSGASVTMVTEWLVRPWDDRTVSPTRRGQPALAKARL